MTENAPSKNAETAQLSPSPLLGSWTILLPTEQESPGRGGKGRWQEERGHITWNLPFLLPPSPIFLPRANQVR